MGTGNNTSLSEDTVFISGHTDWSERRHPDGWEAREKQTEANHYRAWRETR